MNTRGGAQNRPDWVLMSSSRLSLTGLPVTEWETPLLHHGWYVCGASMLMLKYFPSTEPCFIRPRQLAQPNELREQCPCWDTRHKCLVDTRETTSLEASNLSSCHKQKSPNIPRIKDNYNSSSLPSKKWTTRNSVRTIRIFKELPKVQRDQEALQDQTSSRKENYIWSLHLHNGHTTTLSTAREYRESWVSAREALV